MGKTITEQISLYKGAVTLTFYPNSHIYKINNRKIISVTAATKHVDKSQILMAWATKLAREHLIKICEDKKLIYIPDIVYACGLHRARKQEAADKGKLVHEYCEHYIKHSLGIVKEKPEIPKDEQVANGILAFLKWEKENKVKWIESEKKIYSKKYDYCGILDIKAKINNNKKYTLVDLKSGNGVYTDQRYQVSAYEKADTEETGDEYTDFRILLRLDKNTAEFEEHKLGDTDKDFKAFLGCLAIEKREQELKNNLKKEIKTPF